MAVENVEKFEQTLHSDKATQAKVEELFTAWDGDKSDEQAIFDAIVAPVAADAGLPFTYDQNCGPRSSLEGALLSPLPIAGIKLSSRQRRIVKPNTK